MRWNWFTVTGSLLIWAGSSVILYMLLIEHLKKISQKDSKVTGVGRHRCR